MRVSAGTKQLVWAEAGALCAICKRHLLLKDSTDLVGEVCHIVGRSESGPRGRVEDNRLGRNDHSNLILLCPSHHTEVDKNPGKWPVERLRRVKEEHRSFVQSPMSLRPDWFDGVAHLDYVNFPRLSGFPLVAEAFPKIPTSMAVLEGDRAGWVNRLLEILKELPLASPDIRSIKKLSQTLVGLRVNFEETFRTKLGIDYNAISNHELDLQLRRLAAQGIEKMPHVYSRFNGFKLILTIDPRWITFATSWSRFFSGITRFKGVAIIKGVNKSTKVITAAPLFMGMPIELEMKKFLSSMAIQEPLKTVDMQFKGLREK